MSVHTLPRRRAADRNGLAEADAAALHLVIREEREALARSLGLQGDLQQFADSELDELIGLCESMEDGRKPFDRRVAGVVLALVAALALALAWQV